MAHGSPPARRDVRRDGETGARVRPSRPAGSRGGATAARRGSSEGGFTLIELVVAMGLLAILMSASLYTVMQGLRLSRDNQDRVVAANVVTGVLEKLQTVALTTAGFDTIPVTTETLPNQTSAGVTFRLTQTAEWVNRGLSGSSCNSGTNASLILRATVTATWGSAGSVSQSALLAAPNGTFSAGNGSLAVQVSSSAGTGLSGADVTVSNTLAPAVNQTITTGSDGCAFFAQLPPSTGHPPYNVTVASTGGVDVKEQPTFTTTESVSSGTVSLLTGSNAINYDQGGSVLWAYTPASPSPALGMPVSLDSSSQNLTDDLYAWTTGSLNPVYPGTYASIFAGACTDADPAGLDKNLNHFYTGVAPAPVTVAPDAPTSATVTLYPLNLEIVNAAGQPITNAVSPPASPPSATAGATSLSGGGACPNGAPIYTLNAVSNNGALSTSSTGVGLGHLAISVVVTVNGVQEAGSVNVWIRPDGVYSVNPDGTLGSTEYYSFGGAGGTVPVPVS